MPKGAEIQCRGEYVQTGSVLPFGNSCNMKVVGLQKLEAYQDQNIGNCDGIDIKSGWGKSLPLELQLIKGLCSGGAKAVRLSSRQPGQ